MDGTDATPRRTLWDGRRIPALGLGCWAVGGPVDAGGTRTGWGEVDDRESERALRRAVDLGIRFVDTAPAYGAGHSETVLGRALSGHPEVAVSTKVGYAIDEAGRSFLGEQPRAEDVRASVEGSLRRLRRERVDLVHLHLNELPVAAADAVFEALEDLCRAGTVGAYGWSTDFPDRAAAFADRPGFVSVQHALNVFFWAEALLPVVEAHGLLSVNRSPLAMGALSGKYGRDDVLPADDVRGQGAEWLSYFRGGRLAEDHARMLDAVRDLLRTDGRTLVQGALAWIWARSPSTLPIPGFRTAEQVEDLAGALAAGPLRPEVMAEIERVIDRPDEGDPQPR